MIKRTIVLVIILSAILFIHSCTKDKINTAGDNAIYSEIKQPGYTYYMNGEVLSAASSSPHGAFKLRYNSIAAAALDSNDELPQGNSFPAGSVIVKEVIRDGNVSLYAVMKKDPANESSASGWIWAEINADGTAHYSTANKGLACTDCHNDNPHRDLVRTFDFH